MKEPYYVGTFEGTEEADVDWPHRHNFFSIVWFTDSLGINVIDFEEYEIKPNRIFFMQPQQVHNWAYSKNSKGFTLVIDKYIINIETADLFNTIFIDLPSQITTFLNHLFQNLIKEFNKKDELSQSIILSGISYLINQLKRYVSEDKNSKNAKSKIAFEFSKLVSERVSENISVNAYAQKLDLTTERLIEICQESYGKSPKSIILDKKITEAKRLLYFSDNTISQVAYQLGFEDSSYFSRLFKQKTSLSPTEFKSTR